jgi:hypothetical protein
MAPISDDRDRSFEKALARHFRARAQAEASAALRSCADVETLAAYHEGGLAAEQMSLWKTHLQDCPRCQGILTQLAATDAIPFGVADNVEKQKNAGLQVLKPRRPVPWRWAAPAGALAAGLLVWVAMRESKPLQIPEVRKDAASAAKLPAPTPPVAESKTRDAIEDHSTQTRSAETAVGGVLQPKREPSHSGGVAGVPSRPPVASGAQTSENLVSGYSGTPAKSDVEDKASAGARELKEKAAADFRSRSVTPVAPGPEVSASTEAVAEAAPGSAPPSAKPVAGRPPAPAALHQKQEMSGMSRFSENQAMVLAKSLSAVTITAPGNAAQWRIGAAGIIEHSADNGATWTLQTSGVITDLLAGSAPSDKACWVVGRAGTILRTADGGAHWVKVRPPIVDDFVSVFAVDARQASVSPAQGAYQTMDGGATWKKLAPE